MIKTGYFTIDLSSKRRGNEVFFKGKYMASDRFNKFNPKGAPKKKDFEKRTKKVMLSMTESRYKQLQRFQELLNKNTLTSTIDYFIDKGISKTREDFEQVQER